jgi:hypothetical protein
MRGGIVSADLIRILIKKPGRGEREIMREIMREITVSH